VLLIAKGIQDSSVGIATSYGLDGRGSIPEKSKIFLFSTASKPALGPTQPPIQWLPGVSSPGREIGRGVKLTTHFHLVPRSRMLELYLHSPICLSGILKRQLYLIDCEDVSREMCCFNSVGMEFFICQGAFRLTRLPNRAREPPRF
jgi:hypothetical protein